MQHETAVATLLLFQMLCDEVFHWTFISKKADGFSGYTAILTQSYNRKKTLGNAWHFIFDIHIFIPNWDESHLSGIQLMFLVSMDSKHFSTTLTHLLLFLQLNLLNKTESHEKTQLLGSIFIYLYLVFSTKHYWNASNLVDHFIS